RVLVRSTRPEHDMSRRVGDVVTVVRVRVMRTSCARRCPSGQLATGKSHDVEQESSTSWWKRDIPGMRGPPAHPPELTYPCCLPALGEFGEMVPHEGSAPSLTDVGALTEPPRRAVR